MLVPLLSASLSSFYYGANRNPRRVLQTHPLFLPPPPQTLLQTHAFSPHYKRREDFWGVVTRTHRCCSSSRWLSHFTMPPSRGSASVFKGIFNYLLIGQSSVNPLNAWKEKMRESWLTRGSDVQATPSLNPSPSVCQLYDWASHLKNAVSFSMGK